MLDVVTSCDWVSLESVMLVAAALMAMLILRQFDCHASHHGLMAPMVMYGWYSYGHQQPAAHCFKVSWVVVVMKQAVEVEGVVKERVYVSVCQSLLRSVQICEDPPKIGIIICPLFIPT
jgi:hypothetical protein